MSAASSKSDLELEAERLQDARALGRSDTYRRLLAYLVRRTIANDPPREVEIAIDVFGRDSDFDPAADPFVRVYVHNLRKKLEAYYGQHAGEAVARLEIPPGAYRVELARDGVEVLPVRSEEPSTDTRSTDTPSTEPLGEPPAARVVRAWHVGAAVAFTAVFILGWFMGANGDGLFGQSSKAEPSAIWQPLFSSQRQTIVAIGDLFVFEERDPVTGATRAIRESAINSPSDLAQRPGMTPWSYANVGPSPIRYYNEGIAAALYNLRALPGLAERDIQIKAASQLTAHDLRESDVIFIGLYKTLGPLTSIFNASHFDINADFTQLIRRDNGEIYQIEGDPVARHTDYGLFARLAGPAGNVIFVFAGFTDTSLLQIAKAVNGPRPPANLLRDYFPQGVMPESFEILFKASGVDRNDLSSKILQARPLDPRPAWETIR